MRAGKHNQPQRYAFSCVPSSQPHIKPHQHAYSDTTSPNLRTIHSLTAVKSKQAVNRLENHREVCTKSGLASNLAKIKMQAGPGACPWIPETYVLPSRGADKRLYDKFKDAYQAHSNNGTGTTWIVKPTSLNRGNGIEVFNKYEDINKHLASKSAGGLEWE